MANIFPNVFFFSTENIFILIRISMNFFPNDPDNFYINNIGFGNSLPSNIRQAIT